MLRDTARSLGFLRADTASYLEIDTFLRNAQVVLNPSNDIFVVRIPTLHRRAPLTQADYRVRPDKPIGDWEDLVTRLVTITLLQDGVGSQTVQVSLLSGSLNNGYLSVGIQSGVSPFNDGPRKLGRATDNLVTTRLFQSDREISNIIVRVSIVQQRKRKR